MTVKIEVHIEELVLHGFAPHARARIGDAVEAALAVRLAEPGAFGITADRSVDRADGGAITAGPSTLDAAAGAGIADAISTAIRSVR